MAKTLLIGANSTIAQALQEISDRELYDAVEQIYLAELRSVEEIRLLLD